MAKMSIEGLEEYVKAISRCSKNSDAIIKKSIYDGAGILADKMKEAINALPVDNEYGTKDDPVNVVTNIQKADLIEGFGISPIKDDGEYINVKLGWDGYGRIKTKKYPKGVPNQLLARSINSGTSFRKKNPFLRKVVNANKKFIQEVMSKDIEEEIKKEMK